MSFQIKKRELLVLLLQRFPLGWLTTCKKKREPFLKVVFKNKIIIKQKQGKHEKAFWIQMGFGK